MKVLGLIPARGGSKGVPNKNIRNLCGKPLLAYTAETALKSEYLDKVILSTDSQQIAKIGQSLGLDVPFLRPAELGKDHTPTIDVIIHALDWLVSHGDNFDAICLLQPTNPLRRVDDIDNSIKMFQNRKVDTLVSILPVPHHYNPHWVYYKVSKEGHLRLCTGEAEPISRRQDLPAAVHRDGSIYITKCSIVLNKNTLYGDTIIGYEINPEFSTNIDTLDDWRRIEEKLCSV